jgi:hypothetical protein
MISHPIPKTPINVVAAKARLLLIMVHSPRDRRMLPLLVVPLVFSSEGVVVLWVRD